MKSIQGIIALGVAAALVFVGTFLLNYLHTGKTAPRVEAPQVRLTFADPETNYPGPTDQPVEEEIGTPKSHDFWFKNDNPAALPVGVFSKTCQCTHVELWIAPADRKEIPAPAEREKAMKELESQTQPMELKDRDADAIASVPAGAVGALRLRWTGDRLGPKDLAAVLWMGEKGGGSQQRFLIRTLFVGPLQSLPEVDLGVQPRERLPIKTAVPCWSPTRAEFSLDAYVLQNRGKNKDSNPFTVGKPVPFTEKEFARLRSDPNIGAVLSGYVVPIELRKESPDGTTPFDLGLFRQRIVLKMDEEHEVQVVVKGSIEGDLRVVGAEAANPVHFPSFDRTTGASQPVVVESEADVASLTLDKKRTPPFLDVDFPPGEPEKKGDRKLWKLTVKWVPDSEAVGVFPRDEDGYRDSAVYIKPVYAQPNATAPSLRVPVFGKADAPQ